MAASTAEGTFNIAKVPVGKHQLVASAAFYDSRTLTIEVTSGRELVLQIPLQEKVSQQKDVRVVGRKQGEVLNKTLIDMQQIHGCLRAPLQDQLPGFP